jgi:hypothetical protein
MATDAVHNVTVTDRMRAAGFELVEVGMLGGRAAAAYHADVAGLALLVMHGTGVPQDLDAPATLVLCGGMAANVIVERPFPSLREMLASYDGNDLDSIVSDHYGRTAQVADSLRGGVCVRTSAGQFGISYANRHALARDHRTGLARGKGDLPDDERTALIARYDAWLAAIPAPLTAAEHRVLLAVAGTRQVHRTTRATRDPLERLAAAGLVEYSEANGWLATTAGRAVLAADATTGRR